MKVHALDSSENCRPVIFKMCLNLDLSNIASCLDSYYIFIRNIQNWYNVPLNICATNCSLQDGSINISHDTYCSYNVLLMLLLLKVGSVFSPLDMWTCDYGGIYAIYLPKSSHQQQYSFLLIYLGSLHLERSSHTLWKQEDHTKWACVGILCESCSWDPNRPWALISSVSSAGSSLQPLNPVFICCLRTSWNSDKSLLQNSVLSHHGSSQPGVDASAALPHVMALGLNCLGREGEGRRGISIESR